MVGDAGGRTREFTSGVMLHEFLCAVTCSYPGFSIFHDGLIDGDRFIPFKFQTDDLTFTDAALIDGLFQLFSPDLPDPLAGFEMNVIVHAVLFIELVMRPAMLQQATFYAVFKVLGFRGERLLPCRFRGLNRRHGRTSGRGRGRLFSCRCRAGRVFAEDWPERARSQASRAWH